MSYLSYSLCTFKKLYTNSAEIGRILKASPDRPDGSGR